MAVKKTTVKKSSPIKYAATKKPNVYESGPYSSPKSKGYATQVKKVAKKNAVVKKNQTANKTRDTKPGMTNNGPRRRAI